MGQIFKNAEFCLDFAPSVILTGDIDGDGRMELAAVSANSAGVTCAAVYTAGGRLLWNFGSFCSGDFGVEVPAQLYDWDDDGFVELVCVTGGRFTVLDGRTGAVKQSFPVGFECAAVIPASLDKPPGGVILTDRQGMLRAYDGLFNLLWTKDGLPGVFPRACDANLDGIDEIFTGRELLDGAGRLLWADSTAPMPDSVSAGYFDKKTDRKSTRLNSSH